MGSVVKKRRKGMIGRFKLVGFDPLPGGAQLTVEVTMEIDGNDKPACVAESVSRRFTQAG